jgi:hypothetical protein
LKKIEDILAVCVEDVKSGRATLEECLTRYPSIRDELEPLLKLALSIKEPPPLRPSADFKIRAKVSLMEHIHSSRKKSWLPVTLGLTKGWLKTAAIVLVVVLVVSALGTGTAYASQSSLPGEVLYPVKIATENVRRTFTFDDDARIELELSFADTRLEEMEALVSKNPLEIAAAADRYANNISTAMEKAEGAGGSGFEERLEAIALSTSRHLSIIDDIDDVVSPAGKGSVGRVAETAISAQLKVLKSLAEEDPVKAMEINSHTMQNRLDKAEKAADKGMVSEVVDALDQFEDMHRFGDEISQMARQAGYDTTAIDASNEKAVSKKIEIIKKIHGKAPDEPTGNDRGQGHGQGSGGSSYQDQGNNISAAPYNSSVDSGDTLEDNDSPPENPDNGSPGETGNPQGPGSPSEGPGSGSSGKIEN